ncbi:MAG: DUF4294 domain-containing protein [Bacteroidales bacterium]|nr:DUF4294 domain-containing protein [Bacteroidales bacterium]
MILFCMLAAGASGQQPDSPMHSGDSTGGRVYIIQNVERDGVVMPEIEIREITIAGSRAGKAAVAREEKRNARLIYNIRRVYPYAIIARERLMQVAAELEAMETETERREYLKETEKDVFAKYKDEITNLTITQGRILIKLIDRETQNTSFQLIRDYRGGVSAVFWQGIARLFGSNLKAEYDRFGEDAEIESIVADIEAGRL